MAKVMTIKERNTWVATVLLVLESDSDSKVADFFFILLRYDEIFVCKYNIAAANMNTTLITSSNRNSKSFIYISIECFYHKIVIQHTTKIEHINAN